MKIRNVAFEKLMNESLSNPATFEQERPWRLRHEAVSILHQPKNDILAKENTEYFSYLSMKQI